MCYNSLLSGSLIIVMKKLILISVFIFFVTVLFCNGFESIEKIRSSGELRILQTEDHWYPFYYLDEEQNLAGIDIELGKYIASQMGVEANFIKTSYTHETIERGLENGEGDIILSYYSYSPERSSQIYISSPYLIQNLSLLINNQILEIIRKKYGDLSAENLYKGINSPSVTLVTVENTVYESLARELFPLTRLELVDSIGSLDSVLSEDEFDAFFLNNLWTETFIIHNPYLLLRYTLELLPEEDQIVIGVSSLNPDLLEWINRFLSSEYNKTDEFLAKYIDYDLISEIITRKNNVKVPSPIFEDPYRWIILFLLILLAYLFIRNSQKKLARENENNKAPHWLLNIWTIIFSMIIGFYSGAVFPNIVEGISPVGDLFFNYLLLCGLPILFCVVTLNFLKLLLQTNGRNFFLKFISIIVVFFIVGSLVGVLTGIIIQPGSGIPRDSQETLVASMQEDDIYENVTLTTGSILWSLPKNMIDNSIIKAFAENKTLAIVFFAILFAVSLKFLTATKRKTLTYVVETMNEAFMFMFKLSYYVLPFGIFSLMMSQASVFTEDIEVIKSLLILIVCEFICFIVWFFIGTFLGAKLAHISPGKYLGVIKKPVMIIFALLSTVAVIPEAENTVKREKYFKGEKQRGVLPLLIIMLQPGTASLFALVTIFNLQLIGYDMSFGDYIYILVASMIAVFATIGVPSPLDLFTISMVVLPFNIPPAQAVFFLLPWMYSGRRLDAANMIIGDFAVIQLFRDKVKKKFKSGNAKRK